MEVALPTKGHLSSLQVIVQDNSTGGGGQHGATVATAVASLAAVNSPCSKAQSRRMYRVRSHRRMETASPCGSGGKGGYGGGLAFSGMLVVQASTIEGNNTGPGGTWRQVPILRPWRRRRRRPWRRFGMHRHAGRARPAFSRAISPVKGAMAAATTAITAAKGERAARGGGIYAAIPCTGNVE